MSAALAAQQDALLAALLAPRHADAINLIAAEAIPMRARGLNGLKRGLLAYRSNAHALAQRALAAAYPQVAGRLGEEDFRGLAVNFWIAHPPRSGDLAQWGEALAAYIESLDGLQADHPGLAALARVEWALHSLATAADPVADAASFSLLAERDAAALTLRLAPCACVEGRVVWRSGLQPRSRKAAEGEPSFVAALRQGASLLAAVEAAPHFDFNAWLAPAVESGLALGIAALENKA